MRILLLNWRDPLNPKAGGAEIVTHHHAKAWIAAGNRVVWLASRYKNAKEVEIIDGVTIIRKGNILTLFFHAFFFYLFSGTPFDIVIDEIHGIPFFTPLYIRKQKIAFIHEVAQEIWDYMCPFPISLLGKFLETCYLPLYRHLPVWTDAESTIDDLHRLGFQRDNCTAIPCPVENKTLSKLPQKEKHPTFIFVSRVVKMKGVEEVIKAFGFIYKENLMAKLWIVGKGDRTYIEKLKNMTKEYGVSRQITFWGNVSDEQKLTLLSKAHILLHASVKEGWGLVVIEAASQATPAVVYNVSGLKDSVKNKKTGIVLSINSPQEMAREALQLVIDKKEYNKFQKNCLLWAKSLTWDRVTKQSLDLLESTIHE